MPRGVRRAQFKLLSQADITEINGLAQRFQRDVGAVLSRATGVPVPTQRFQAPTVKRKRRPKEEKPS